MQFWSKPRENNDTFVDEKRKERKIQTFHIKSIERHLLLLLLVTWPQISNNTREERRKESKFLVNLFPSSEEHNRGGGGRKSRRRGASITRRLIVNYSDCLYENKLGPCLGLASHELNNRNRSRNFRRWLNKVINYREVIRSIRHATFHVNLTAATLPPGEG